MNPRKLLSKIKAPENLRRTLSRMRAKSGRTPRVVFTNGCFDLLHNGHVRYLEKARHQGDCLIVAVNSDRSVRVLKGPKRPINRLPDRLEVIAALESVDFVTFFDEDTPRNLINYLRPDVLVKGADWSIDKTAGAREVQSWGGTVKFLSYVPGRSTTKIIAKARTR